MHIFIVSMLLLNNLGWWYNIERCWIVFFSFWPNGHLGVMNLHKKLSNGHFG